MEHPCQPPAETSRVAPRRSKFPGPFRNLCHPIGSSSNKNSNAADARYLALMATVILKYLFATHLWGVYPYEKELGEDVGPYALYPKVPLLLLLGNETPGAKVSREHAKLLRGELLLKTLNGKSVQLLSYAAYILIEFVSAYFSRESQDR